MKFTGKSIIQKSTAILIIFNLLIVNFAIVGQNAVSYAIDIVKTNSNNVEFSAYFVDDKSEQVSSIEKPINAEDLKLYVEVSVKNEGYFNGQITLEESNFKLKEEFTDANISKIEGNTVTLKQINAGSTVKLELGIETIKEDVLEKESLDATSKVNLTGTYKSSKKDVEIEGIAKVKLSLKSPEEAKAVLETNLLTNSVYKKEGENKKIVQLLISSNVENNSYPVKETNIELNVPKDTEKVEVKKRGAGATESTLELDESSYKYDAENKKLTINLKNEEEDGKIKWSKDGKDELIVTFILPENADIKEEKTVIEDKITLYDDKELVAKTEVELGEEKEGAITYNVTSEESKIYKGKIYTGEERTYNVKTSINVNYIGAASDIKLEEKASTYLVGEKEAKANITYKQSKINKDEFVRILGEEGYITIKNQDGAVIANINIDSEVGEDGNYVIDYPNDVTALTIETSAPANVGVIEINHTKSINSAGYTRAQLRQVTQIRNLVTGSYVVEEEERVQDAENKIDLKETKSQAKLEVGTETLSTTATNENVKIKATLCTDGEYKDTFKNPTLKITLPSQVTHVSAKCKLLYGNGLNLSEAKVVEEDGHKVIYIKLDGEQAGYQGEAVKGPTVVVYANLELDKLAASSNEQIVLNYTNENAQEYVDGGEVKKDIEVVSEMSLITTNNISEYGVETLGNEGTKRIDLERNAGSKNAQIDISITNNEASKIENVKILGKFPTKVENDENNNLEVVLASGISMQNSNATVYYSSKENPSNDLQDSNNGWATTGNSRETKSYLIVIDSLEEGETFNANYKITIPEGLGYNMNAKESYSVSYTNTANSQFVEAKSTEILLTTGKGPEIEAEVVAMQGDEELQDGATVNAGEVITYRVKVTNVGNLEAENVIVTGGVPDGTQYIKLQKTELKGEGGWNDEYKTEYQEIEDSPKFKLKKLEAGKSAFLEYQVRANEDIKKEKETRNNVKIDYNDASIEVGKSLKLQEGKVQLEMLPDVKDIEILKGGDTYSYKLNVRNISDKDIKDLPIKVFCSNNGDIVDISYDCNAKDDNGNPIKEKEEEKMISIENSNEFVIEDLPKNSNIVVFISFKIKQNVTDKSFSMKAIATINNKKYKSNEITKKSESINAKIDIQSETQGKNVVPGDEIKYTIRVKNTGDIKAEYLQIEDNISKYVDITNVNIDGKDVEFNVNYDYVETDNILQLVFEDNLEVGEVRNIEITAKIEEDYSNTDDLQILNYAKLYSNYQMLEETGQIINILPGLGEESDEEEKTDNSSTRMISGTAWIDENQDGIRDTNEQILSGVKVKLLDVNTNEFAKNSDGEDIEVTTGEDGKYTLSKVPKGKYTVVFDYDMEKYLTTTYQAESSSENKNSDVETSTISIGGKDKKYAVTDVLDLNDANYANVDMGTVEAKNFDLELQKGVSKITVANDKETKTYQFDNDTLAKVEIDSKYLSNSNVVIEYKIKVTNTGEVAGYVKNIVDYKPTDLTFSSSLNKDWYQSGEKIYNSSLANSKIEPGETKELTLVLTKKMTESNTGLINNVAEIESSYNELGVKDSDSTEGNRIQGEDDMAGADVIISVKTGAIISYILITFATIMIVLGISYLIYKKVIEKNIKI